MLLLSVVLFTFYMYNYIEQHNGMTIPKLINQIPRFVNLKAHYNFLTIFSINNTPKQDIPQHDTGT